MPENTPPSILYETIDRIASITLNRPEKRNALSDQMVGALKAAFSKAQQDEKVKVVVLKGKGKAFCAGADLAYLQKLQAYTYEENLTDSRELKELFHQIYTFPKPVIAQVQGHALAGGCGLASICDFAFSAPHALFGYTEVKIGFVPALVAAFLLRKLGGSAARAILLSGKLFPAQEARSLGLVHDVISEEALEEKTRDFAIMLCEQNSGKAMELTKQTLLALEGMGLDEGLEFAAQQNAKARATSDCKKGIAAFLDKEKLIW